jgi:hypothetical protein
MCLYAGDAGAGRAAARAGEHTLASSTDIRPGRAAVWKSGGSRGGDREHTAGSHPLHRPERQLSAVLPVPQSVASAAHRLLDHLSLPAPGRTSHLTAPLSGGAYTHTHIYTHTYTYTCIHTHTNTHTNIHSNAHTNTHTRTHTYTHTQAYTCRESVEGVRCALCTAISGLATLRARLARLGQRRVTEERRGKMDQLIRAIMHLKHKVKRIHSEHLRFPTGGLGGGAHT